MNNILVKDINSTLFKQMSSFSSFAIKKTEFVIYHIVFTSSVTRNS